tara:strand:+ start:191 stop:412 length:222 start_codon:yes stop_codon:yes gene_type:complete
MSDREIMDAKGFGRVYTSESKKQELPDARKHQIISFIKSGFRILGYLLIPYSLPIAAGVLIFSEIIGIIEELV